MTMRLAVGVYSCLMFLLAGYLLGSPEGVRRRAVRALERGPTWGKGILLRFVRSDAYQWNVRAVGIGALLMALMLALAAVRAR